MNPQGSLGWGKEGGNESSPRNCRGMNLGQSMKENIQEGGNKTTPVVAQGVGTTGGECVIWYVASWLPGELQC